LARASRLKVFAFTATLPYTVTHAGRRKITIAAGEEIAHHTDMLDAHTNAVNMSAPLRVTFQGEPGAFSEQVIQKHWNGTAAAVPSLTFSDAIAQVISNHAAFAVIPVENAIAGAVMPALAALESAQMHLTHCGEVRIDVQLCLMAPRGATVASLSQVYSHAMALAQSHAFLATHAHITPLVHEDTAGAARDVAAWNDITRAAIAAEPAAAQYGLEILARSVQDRPDNWTRFVIVARHRNAPTRA
jgi:prephenate dehydratase